MYKFFILILSLSFYQISVSNGESLKNAIEHLNKIQTGVNYTSNCSNCPTALPSSASATLLSPKNHVKLNLTVLSEEKANLLFQELAANPTIPFKYSKDGCFARAHKMVRLLEDKGIISGKAWVVGDIYATTASEAFVNWEYHVAPVVLVQEKDGPKPYVIDPSMADKAIPYLEWKNKMLVEPDSVISDEYYTNRFVFRITDRNKNLKFYNKKDLKLSDAINNLFLEYKTEEFQ